MTDNNEGRFFTGFIFGAVIGLVTGLLYAPRSGAEIRGIIKEKADLVRIKADEVAQKIQSTAEEVQQQVHKFQ